MADDFISGFLAGQGDGNSNRGGMFGGDGWWAIIIFALIFGWGRGGYGAGNGAGDGGSTGTGAAMAGYVLTSDFANLERKLDGVNNGLCDGFYAMNTGMLNGFAGVTQAVTSGFSTAELARCNQQAALMQQLDAVRAEEAVVIIREKLADIAERSGAEQRIHQRMGQHIRVRVAEQPLLIRYLDPAEDQLPPLDELMHIIPMPYSHSSLLCSL